MDALVTMCSRNTSRNMVWAWMLWSPYALGTRAEIWFGRGCSGHRMLAEHKRNYDLGTEALVTVCSWNTNGIMVWAWMLWSPYALGTRAELWFGHRCTGHRMCLNTNGRHGCSGHRMLLEHERNYCLVMHALVTVCSWITNSSMAWVCMRL